MAKLVLGATLLFALAQVSLPLHAQQGSVSLNVCNAGEVGIDVFISRSGKVSSSHIGPADCALVAKSVGSMGPTYVGLAFVDAHGQWGAARRQDLLPFWGDLPSSDDEVLDRANQSARVPHGNTTVSLAMQLLFRPPAPTCTTTEYHSVIPLGATTAEAEAIRSRDSMVPGETICDTLSYKLNVLAYPDSREITFKKFCDSCDRKAEARLTPEERAANQRRANAVNQAIRGMEATGPVLAAVMGNAVNLGNQALEEERRERQKELAPSQRVNWHDMREFLSLALPANPNQEPINRKIIVQGRVSSVGPRPGEAAWANVYFAEAPDKRFNVTTSSPDIFQDMFGPDFSSHMIGKTLEVEGEVTRAYCSGGCIRVSLSRQVRLVGSGAGMVAAMAAPNITFPKPGLTPEGEAAKKRIDAADRARENSVYYKPSEEHIKRDITDHCRVMNSLSMMPNLTAEEMIDLREIQTRDGMAKYAAKQEKCISEYDASAISANRKAAVVYCLRTNNYLDVGSLNSYTM